MTRIRGANALIQDLPPGSSGEKHVVMPAVTVHAAKGMEQQKRKQETFQRTTPSRPANLKASAIRTRTD
jgi:hypothetical protein